MVGSPPRLSVAPRTLAGALTLTTEVATTDRGAPRCAAPAYKGTTACFSTTAGEKEQVGFAPRSAPSRTSGQRYPAVPARSGLSYQESGSISGNGKKKACQTLVLLNRVENLRFFLLSLFDSLVDVNVALK